MSARIIGATTTARHSRLASPVLEGRRRNRGFSLIEVMVTIAIMAILLGIGVSSMREWMADMRVRVLAEGLHTGMQLARTEAIRLNELVRFQLTSNLASTCALSSSVGNWIVSIDDPTGACNSDPAPQATILTAVAPRVIQARPVAEGGGGTLAVRASIMPAATGAVRTTLIYNGAGRLSGANNIEVIEIPDPATLPAGTTCQHQGGDLRCLRIRILSGGDARICDPKVVDANDPRICPP